LTVYENIRVPFFSNQRAGYWVALRVDLCRGVDPETTADAIKEMKAAGADIVGDA